jgi:hypothetical protein
MIEVQYNGLGDPIGIAENGSTYSLEALIAMAQRVSALEAHGAILRSALESIANWENGGEPDGDAHGVYWLTCGVCQERERVAERALAAIQADVFNGEIGRLAAEHERLIAALSAAQSHHLAWVQRCERAEAEVMALRARLPALEAAAGVETAAAVGVGGTK